MLNTVFNLCTCKRHGPTSTQIAQKKAQLERDVQVSLPPVECVKRVKAMHAAVVDKLTELLPSIVREGKVSRQVTVAERSVSNIGHGGVEDCFQFARQMFDRCPTTRIQVLTSMRRVLQEKREINLQKPPQWWTEGWRRDLRKRARYLVRHEWVEARTAGQVECWTQNQVKNTVAVEKAAATQAKAARLSDKALTMPGGNVGTGEEKQTLPAGIELDHETAQTVDFGDGTWRQQERHNQLKLRNLRKDKRTPQLTAELVRVGLIRAAGADISLGGGVAALLTRLRKVMLAEHTVQHKLDTEQAAAEHAMGGRGQRQRTARVYGDDWDV